jgi:uncharacterized membrane protein
MLSHLSYWPWIIGAVVSFFAALITTKRTVGETYIDPGIATFGGGAVAVIFSGLIEAANTGVFVDRGIGDILDATLGLALTSLISSFAGGMPASFMLFKMRGN